MTCGPTSVPGGTTDWASAGIAVSSVTDKAPMSAYPNLFTPTTLSFATSAWERYPHPTPFILTLATTSSIRQGADPLDRALETVGEPDARHPPERRRGLADIRASNVRIVDGPVEDLHLLGISQVHRFGDDVRRQEPPDALHQVLDIAERSRLRAVAVHRQRRSLEGLIDERRHGTAVAAAHAGAVRVEDADDLDGHTVRPVVGHHHRLRVPLGLVVDAARPDGVHVPPVRLGLRVNLWVPVDLRRRRQEQTRMLRLRQPQRAERPQRPDLQRLDRIRQIVRRRRRRRQVEDPIEIAVDVEVVRHVVLLESEPP